MAIHLISQIPQSFFLSPKFPLFSTNFLPISRIVQATSNSNNAVPETTPKRRGRPKGSPKTAKVNPTKTKKSKGSPQKPDIENGSIPDLAEIDDFDDGMDFPYLDPPLVCCFGAVQNAFVPTVMMQWNPVWNVAISHVRLGGRAEVMGKVGKDDFGEELVLMMNEERVQTRSVKFDANFKTGCSFMKVKFTDDGRMMMELVKEAAEDSLLPSELNLAVLKEARIFHFDSKVLTSPSMKSTLFKAINLSRKFGGLIFFDLNLSLPLWKSRDETKEIIKQAWNEADIIEVSRQELEFLLDEEHHERKRNYRPQYYAEDYDKTKDKRDNHNYTREEISPLWHDKLKFLFVTDGTLSIHYYSPLFDGVVVGTEDVLITPSTCDTTGSGQAVVAGIMRKLTTYPEMYEDRDVLERQLRFAIGTAGIISRCTVGDVTESTTQNLKEEVYVSSVW